MNIIYRLALLSLLLSLTTGPLVADEKARPVIAYRVEEATFNDTIEALGNLIANESVVLTSPVTDVVSAIHFEDGERVEAGATLVEMTNNEERALLEEARSRAGEAKKQFARVRELVAKRAASGALIDQRRRELETANAQLKGIKSRLQDRLILAPFSGVVGLRTISVGSLLQPGDRIATIDDDSVMKLDFSVPTTFFPALSEGMTIEARTEAVPSKTFFGTVASIDSRADPVTRSILVRALIPNPEQLLRPGFLMTVELASRERSAAAVPEEALLHSGEQTFLFLLQQKEGALRVTKQEVEVGLRSNGVAEITDGLSMDDLVVLRGIQQIQGGSVVQVTEEVTLRQEIAPLLSRGFASAGEE